MSEFKKFQQAIMIQFDKMKSHNLFLTEVDKDVMWDTYLSRFPEGTNPIYKERTEHDCNCCKQFIRVAGNLVAVIDEKLVSIWDIDVDVSHYQVVADRMSKLIKEAKIKNTFLHYEKKAGTKFNVQNLESGEEIKWSHFYLDLPSKTFSSDDDIGTKLSENRSNKEVLKRSLDELSIESSNIVLDLIDQNSLYRGDQYKGIVESFLRVQKEYSELKCDKDIYCWNLSIGLGGAGKVRNNVIGTLLSDISEGMPLDVAVKRFEDKVAPQNYKRPSALVTKGMIKKAKEKVAELGLEDSLERRYAIKDDLTINNILFADRISKKVISNVFDELEEDVKVNIKSLEKVEEIEIEKFLNDILPKSKEIEVLVENKHENNFMSIIAPNNPDAKNLFKWENNFSWAYNGEAADSIKENVKSAGGRVDGVMRFSIQWNDNSDNPNDFDAHCKEPSGNVIMYNNCRKPSKSRTTGQLDVDITQPGQKVAVENITWNNIDKMDEGEYSFIVHNFSHNGGMSGFKAEIEYNGQIYHYEYDKGLKNKEEVLVAKISFSKEKGIKFIESLKSTSSSKEIWNIETQKFQKVSMIMKSPNHWNEIEIGNKHYFFIIDGCKNEGSARGFFNEFLKESLNSDRKVFEILGSKMKAEYSESQLSGVGFSSTKRNHMYCKVKGSFTRIIKVKF
jgi:hypothetical protein